jgi:hypothetical protein
VVYERVNATPLDVHLHYFCSIIICVSTSRLLHIIYTTHFPLFHCYHCSLVYSDHGYQCISSSVS